MLISAKYMRNIQKYLEICENMQNYAKYAKKSETCKNMQIFKNVLKSKYKRTLHIFLIKQHDKTSYISKSNEIIQKINNFK